ATANGEGAIALAVVVAVALAVTIAPRCTRPLACALLSVSVTMRIHHSVAASILALSCALLTPSCVLSTEPPTEIKLDEAQSSNCPEPIGETEQEVLGGLYEPEDFQFAVIVKDDGKDGAGGWQVATNASSFVAKVSGKTIYRWECRLEIGMPLRSALKGR